MVASNNFITDPLGNFVHLPHTLCEVDEKKMDISEAYDDCTSAIEQPALMIRINEEEGMEFFYFRSLGWHNTLLIGTQKKDGVWTAHKCYQNPTNDFLISLIRKGMLINPWKKS